MVATVMKHERMVRDMAAQDRVVEISETTLGNHGSINLSGSAPGRNIITAVQFLTDGTVTAATDATGHNNATLTGVEFVAGSIVYGKWSQVDVTGDAIGYLGK